MTAIEYAKEIDKVDAQIDALMLKLADLEGLRQYLWTQWNYQKKREGQHEQQLEIAV